MKRVAIVYQEASPPVRNGVIKPMKPGGYSDSGADIAYALKQRNLQLVTPVDQPGVRDDLDWVFPDTHEGLQDAVSKGANTIWLNTVLYAGHPFEEFLKLGISVIGQVPKNVDLYDDKITTIQLLRDHQLAVPKSIVIREENAQDYQLDFPFPVVAKPIRGRGSQGVSLVSAKDELDKKITDIFSSKVFGNALYVEEYLSGEELTISIMPPGQYKIDDRLVRKKEFWALPAVKRFNHYRGIAPYNGVVAVIRNSEVLSDEALQSQVILDLYKDCEKAAALVEAKAPIRIDCRANAEGEYFLFDLNMKPNMTGASRPHRQDQNSLTALAAQRIGWDFGDLVENMLHQEWKEN